MDAWKHSIEGCVAAQAWSRYAYKAPVDQSPKPTSQLAGSGVRVNVRADVTQTGGVSSKRTSGPRRRNPSFVRVVRNPPGGSQLTERRLTVKLHYPPTRVALSCVLLSAL